MTTTSSAPESAVLIAGIGATFHLFRLAIDLVVCASAKESKHYSVDHHDDTKKGGGDGKKKSKKTSKDVESGSSLKERESAPLLSKEGNYGSASTAEAAAPPNDHEPTHRFLQSVLPPASLAIQTLLCVYFIAACVVHTRSNDKEVIYSPVLLGSAGTSTFLGILLNLRDYRRERFGYAQRLFYSLSTFTLLSGDIILLYSSSRVSQSGLSLSDTVTANALLIYFILSCLESWLLESPKDPETTSQSTKKTLSRKAIFIMLKPYIWPDATSSDTATLNRARAICTWICVLLSKGCNLISPIYIGKASTALGSLDYPSAVRYSFLYVGLSFVGKFFRETQSLMYLKVAQAAFVQLSEVTFCHLHSLSLDWHLKKKLGEVIRSMDRGISACDTLMKYLFLWLLPALGECIVVCVIFVSYFNYLPVAVCVFFFAFVYMLMTILVTLWRKKFRKAVAKSDNDWHDRCTDSLINFETVKYFTAEVLEMKKFGAAVNKFQTGSVYVQASMSFLNILQQLLFHLCLGTALSLAAYGIRKRLNCCVSDEVNCASALSECCAEVSQQVCPGMNVGDFVAVLTYTINFFGPLNFLGSVYNAIVMAIVDLTNLSELLAENPDVQDAPDATVLSKYPLRGDIAVEFDNVCFHYPTQPESNGLKGLSFTMKRGTITAIVGTTGAGKTTVSRLLFRFYDVLSGSLRINNTDVRTVTQKSLRDQIGVVPQNTSLFNDTLLSNIQYGNQHASMEDIDKVLKSAQLDNFISTLPDGLQTMVGDRGLKLSGGEKQRVAIARCLLKNPPIVILDEATSALDTLTENSVQDALDKLGEERTCLVIAHRLGTIRNADNIIVLGDGKVMEQGTHEELMEMEYGKYREMWDMQLSSNRGSRSSSRVDLTKL